MNNRVTYISNSAKYSLIILLFPIVTLLNSCKDNTGTLGPNVLPKSDLVYAEVDTTTIVTSTFLKDSVQTNNTVSSLLGSYNDPIFGLSKSSIYTEVYPANNGGTLPPWYTNCTVDSVVLLLQLYGSPYGNSDPQTFAVYTTTTKVDSLHNYYSDTNLSHSSAPIGLQQVTIPGSPGVNDDTLRIRLNKSWWTGFVTNLEFGSNWTSTFQSVIKGLYITPTNPLQLPAQGAIFNIDLSNSFSGIYVYYHFNGIVGDTEHTVCIPIGGPAGGYFTHFDHNYAPSPINNTRPYGPRDSINGGQFVYVQAMGGATGRINFPNLYKNWAKKGPLIVNQAVLNLPVDEQDISNNLPALTSLNVVSTGPTWVEIDLPDLGQPYYGGSYNGNSYTFVITQYIQGVINGKDTDRGLFIVPLNSATTAGSVVLYGAQHSTNKPSLTIYYTPLKKS